MAARVIGQFVRPTDSSKAASRPKKTKKNPAAVLLGRLGGLKGGVARAQALTGTERTLIARRAAQARWHKEQDGTDAS